MDEDGLRCLLMGFDGAELVSGAFDRAERTGELSRGKRGRSRRVGNFAWNGRINVGES